MVTGTAAAGGMRSAPSAAGAADVRAVAGQRQHGRTQTDAISLCCRSHGVMLATRCKNRADSIATPPPTSASIRPSTRTRASGSGFRWTSATGTGAGCACCRRGARSGAADGPGADVYSQAGRSNSSPCASLGGGPVLVTKPSCQPVIPSSVAMISKPSG
jgi:hypothetical protein